MMNIAAVLCSYISCSQSAGPMTAGLDLDFLSRYKPIFNFSPLGAAVEKGIELTLAATQLCKFEKVI